MKKCVPAGEQCSSTTVSGELAAIRTVLLYNGGIYFSGIHFLIYLRFVRGTNVRFRTFEKQVLHTYEKVPYEGHGEEQINKYTAVAFGRAAFLRF
jgi:hypothetical protein